MKRSATVVILTLTLAIAGAGTALAKDYPPSPNGGNAGASGGGGNIAFTGANVTLGMILVVALVAIGLAALLVGRRRARA